MRNAWILAALLAPMLGLRAEGLSGTAATEAAALSPTAKLGAAAPELPRALSVSAAPELPAAITESTEAVVTPEPQQEEEAEDFIVQPTSRGIPWSDMALGGLGAGVLGSAVAFFSDDSQSGYQWDKFHQDLPIYAAGGVLLGAISGYILGVTDPPKPKPPEPKAKAGLDVAGLMAGASARGGRVDLLLRY